MSAEAAAAYKLAGAQDLTRLAFREAQIAFERALQLMPGPVSRDRVETALAFANACEITGQRASQRAALDEALTGARQLNDQPLLLQGLLISGYALEQTGQLDAAEAQLRQALALARQLQNAADETYAIFLLGDCCIQRGQWPQARTYFEQALAQARRHKNFTLEGKALRGLAMAARQTGAPHDSVRLFEQALAVHRKANDRWSEMVTWVILLSIHYDLGAWDQLMAEADALSQMASDYGDYARACKCAAPQGSGRLFAGRV